MLAPGGGQALSGKQLPWLSVQVLQKQMLPSEKPPAHTSLPQAAQAFPFEPQALSEVPT
jgi:hypothetical protein